MKQPGIYRIRCRRNGVRYIGRSVDIPTRRGQHKRKLAEGSHPNDMLQSAWNAYGNNSFEFKVLRRADRFLDRWEMFYYKREKFFHGRNVANEIRPSRLAKRWWQFWRK